MNPTRNRSSIIYILLFVAIISIVVSQLQSGNNSQEELSINQLAADIQAGKVGRIEVDDDRVTVEYLVDDNKSISHIEVNSTLVEQLKEYGVSAEQLNAQNV